MRALQVGRSSRVCGRSCSSGAVWTIDDVLGWQQHNDRLMTAQRPRNKTRPDAVVGGELTL